MNRTSIFFLPSILVVACDLGSGGAPSPLIAPAATGAAGSSTVPPQCESGLAAPFISNLDDYAGVRHSVPVEVTIPDSASLDKAELFAGNDTSPAAVSTAPPFTLMWNTAEGPDGLLPVRVKIRDKCGNSKTSKTVPIVVYNKGQEVQFQEGDSGEIEIPTSSAAKAAKHYWDNPSDVRTIMAVFRWQSPPGEDSVDMEIATGFGDCPMKGQMVGMPVASNRSPLFLNVTVDGKFVQTGRHFIHVEPDHVYSFKGKKYPYTAKAYIFNEAFPEPQMPELTGVKGYDGLKGTVPLGVTFTAPMGIDQVDLHAEGVLEPVAGSAVEPFRLDFDTTKLPDGVVSLFARVRDKTGKTWDTKATPAILVNKGLEATLTEGNTGTMTVPTTGEAAGTKLHWNNPENIGSILGVFHWQVPQTAPALTLEGSVGIGECPKNGTVIGTPIKTSASPLFLQAVADDLAVQSGGHFFLAKPMDYDENRGQSYPFDARVYVFKAEPQVTNLKPYAAVEGTVQVETKAHDEFGVSKVELFVGNAAAPAAIATESPFSLQWDTSGSPDGLVDISVRSTNSKGTSLQGKPIRVIVVNGAEEVVFAEGNTGIITVPEHEERTSAKGHWENPVGIKRVIAVADWQLGDGQAPMPFEFTMGSGFCPMIGELDGSPAEGLLPPLALDVSAPNGALAAGKHFLMLKQEEFYTRKGESFPYTIRAYLFR